MSESIRIGICDDQEIVVSNLRRIVEQIQSLENAEWTIRVFYDARTLLNCITEIDILFLDIAMPEMDGIEAGKRVNALNQDCKIIMATGEVERFKEAFHIHAFRFITKPFEMSEIHEAILSALMVSVKNKSISAYRDRICYDIPQKNIQYIQAFNSYIEIRTLSGLFRKDISLKEIELTLDERLFARIHKSYIVNLAWIDRTAGSYVFVGKERLPLSRRQSALFKQKYIYYDLNMRKQGGGKG